MNKVVSWRAWCGLAVVAGLGTLGCSPRSTRTAGDSGEDGTRGEAPHWTRVPISSADLEPAGGKHVLVVKAMPPAGGWKIEIRPIQAPSPAEREFEVVGLAPAGPARVSAGPEVVRCPLDLDGQVKQVIVYDNDDATVIPAP